MSILAIVNIIIGVALLVFGSDFLVRGASRIASAIGVSSLVIGLTVVAYGTSAPEMAVSTVAAAAGKAEIAVGNVVGSNIFNILVILGISAVIIPLTVARQLVRLDVPLMIGVSFLLYLLVWDGSVSRLDGILLFSGAILYTIALIRMSRRETKAAAGDEPKEKMTTRNFVLSLLFLFLGLALLVGGSKLLVDGAVTVAKSLGVSELIIGLTIVAAGTSMPELATSIMAAIRGERDIAIGNVVGSNIFNILAVLGFSGIVSPLPISVGTDVLNNDFPVMLLATLICLPFFITSFKLDRIEGAILLFLYGGYTTFLIMAATNQVNAPVVLQGILLVGGAIFAVTVIAALRGAKRAKLGS